MLGNNVYIAMSLTRHSRSGKHGRLGHQTERNVMQSLIEKYTFYLVLSNMGHARKFKQMHLCSDFNAGPSEAECLIMNPTATLPFSVVCSC